jgi:N-acetylneuraminate epimerase
MKIIVFTVLFMMSFGMVSAADANWSKLPSLPDKEGFAGMFAGVSNDALLVAGGANFPDKRPWEGGVKRWYNEVWALTAKDAQWRQVGALPKALGYGISATIEEGMLCIGGSGPDGHSAQCFVVKWHDGQLTIKPRASLPKPCANASGALVGHTMYVAGGIESPTSTTASHGFWSLDVSDEKASWQELKPWPGRERMLAVSGSDGAAFYLFGGAALHADAEGKPEREWLRDAYRYSPEKGWEKLPDMPRVVVAAPSPAPFLKTGQLLVMTGDDGSKVGFKPETAHPGFPRAAMTFDPKTNLWQSAGEVPFSRATVPVTEWQGSFIIPNGEERPGYRTPEVWQMR